VVTEKIIAGGFVTDVTVTYRGSSPGPNQRGVKNYMVQATDADGAMRRWGFTGVDELDAFTHFSAYLTKRGAKIL
jgi:hypothetical protein